MDPEIVEQLNSQFAQMNELLSQQNSLMAAQVNAAKNAATANKNVATSATGASGELTKLQQTNQAANEKIATAMDGLKRSFDAGAASLKSFGSALASSEMGFKKYGSAVEGAGNAAFDLGKNFGIVGTVLGGLVKGLTMFASQALAMHDTMIQFNRDVTSFAGIIPGTTRNFADLSAEAGYAGDNMAKMGKFIQGLGSNVLSLGDTAGAGAVKFTKLANVGDDVRKSFSKLGYSQEALTEMQAYYIKEQAQSGRALALRTKSEEQLRKESLAYAENLIKISSLTGQSAEDIQREREAVKSEIEERIKVRQEELLAQKAEAEGRQEDADRIRAEGAARRAIIDKYTDLYGQEVGSMAGRALRQGGFDKFTAGLAAAGITVDDLSGQMKAATDEQLAAQKRGASAEELAEIRNKRATQSAEAYSNAQDNFALTLGDAAQYAKDLPTAFGQTAEAFKRGENSIGKSIKDREADAAKSLEEAKKLKDLDEQQRADQDAANIKFQQEFQESMLTLANQINPIVTDATKLAADALTKFNDFINQHILPNLDKIKTAFVALGAVIGILAGASAIGLAIKVFKSIGTAGGALVKMFGWMGDKIKSLFGFGGGGGAAAAAGGEAAAAGSGAAAAGSQASKLGRFGKVLGVAKGLLGKIALPVAALFAAKDAYQGFNADPTASFGGKLANAGKGALSGMTFGLSDYITGGVTTPEDKQQQKDIKEQAKTNAEKITTSSEKNQTTAELNDKTATLQSKNTKHFHETVASFGQIVSSNGKIVVAFGDLVKVFGLHVTKFTNTVQDMMDKLSMMTGPLGSTGKADDPATVEKAMQMQFQKESGGGKNLRTKGLKNASTIGGAYGLSQAARESAFKSMSAEQKQQFTTMTGFKKAPTLDELVNKEGTAFTSEGAKAADRMLAQQFTQNTITSLQKKLGRAPTMADVRGAHWLGEGGYVALLKAAAENPNMSMRDFWKPSWGTVDFKQFPETVSGMIEKIREHAGGSGGDIVALGKQLQSQGIKVTEHPDFGGVTPGVHKGRGHAENRAIDVNVVSGRDVDDPVAAEKLDGIAAQLSSNPNFKVLWRTNGHYDHMHIESVKAARGGVFSGSKAGYPATLHGTEMVAPLSLDSILMKLAKTPADADVTTQLKSVMSGGGESSDNINKILISNTELANVISKKLDDVIDALDNGNDTRKKMLRHSM